MALSGVSLGIASGGSFGPDLFTGMFPWNVGLLVWIDDDLSIEVVGIAQGAARSRHIQSGDWQEVADFAEREGFPEHQCVLRPDGQSDTRIYKEIADWSRLKTCFDSGVAQSSSGKVFVELDLRAFAYPSRMKHIEQAAADGLQRMQSTCPICQAPGFWIRERQPGLPCASCGLPSSSFRNEDWACLRYEHRRNDKHLLLSTTLVDAINLGVELRRRVNAGLNKGETRNALARAVFFNRLGEIRDRSFEQQRYRVSGLNLVTATIVLWNTVCLERAASALRGHGHGVDDALLQYLPPLGWEHINLTGDYLWRSSAKLGAGKFRPLRPLQPA